MTKSSWYRQAGAYRHFLHGSFVEYLFICSLFFLLTILYTNGTLLNGNSSVFVGGPGDGTAGVAWMLRADKGMNPIPPHTDMVNYPEGVDLASPLSITSPLIHFPAWVISRVTSPLMAINIMMYVAFVGIAAIGYWLLKRLTHRWYIAFFSGFTLAFMPYHIFKSVGHIANIFSWMFVALIAASIYLWRSPSWKSALLVALTVAAGFYTDGYYLLLSSVMVATLSAGGVVAKFFLEREKIIPYLRNLLMAAGFTVLLATPIVAVQVASGDQVKGSLSNARADIKTEAHYYSAWAVDYLVPPAFSPFFESFPLYQAAHEAKASRSNKAESALYIGYVVIVLTIIGLIVTAGMVLGRYKNSAIWKRLSNRDKTMMVLLSSFVVVTVPILLSLMGPLDRIFLGSIRVPMLSGILTDYVDLWRVLTRFILPLHALLAVYAGFSLYIVIKLLPARHKFVWPALVVLLTGLVAVEYATAVNRPSFGLSRMPATYLQVRDRDDIKVLAELPITDKPGEVNGFYATGQLIHGKKLINNHVSSYNNGATSALGDEDNPETIDYIRARGADHVILRSDSCIERSWGTLEYVEKIDKNTYKPPAFSGPDYSHMCLYALHPASPTDEMFVALDLNDYMDSAGQNRGVYETYARLPSVTLRLVGADGAILPQGSRATVGLKVRSVGDHRYLWMLTQDEKFVASGKIGMSVGETVIAESVVSGSNIELTFIREDGRAYAMGDIALRLYSATEQ